jgi:hypothetical protein
MDAFKRMQAFSVLSSQNLPTVSEDFLDDCASSKLVTGDSFYWRDVSLKIAIYIKN